MRVTPGLLMSAALLLAAPVVLAKERTAFEQQAREIYQTGVEIRTAKGQGRVPEMVDYLVRELKAGGYDTFGIGGGGAKPSDTFAHGLNERLSVDASYGGLDHWYIVMKELAGRN